MKYMAAGARSFSCMGGWALGVYARKRWNYWASITAPMRWISGDLASREKSATHTRCRILSAWWTSLWKSWELCSAPGGAQHGGNGQPVGGAALPGASAKSGHHRLADCWLFAGAAVKICRVTAALLICFFTCLALSVWHAGGFSIYLRGPGFPGR